MQEEMLHFVSP